jgi:transcription factor C subunit 7
MPVTEILLLRHGHRLAWILDPMTGKYSSNHPFPTRRPADPPLASHGVRQANETAAFLSSTLSDAACHDRLRIYSSLFYRCLETLKPTVEKLREGVSSDSSFADSAKLLRSLEVRGERGFGEWFGRAWFEQPAPADAGQLKEKFFPWVDEDYMSKLIPDRHGEKIEELHGRITKALDLVIRDVDEEFEAAGRGEEDVTLLICGHAAQIICSGRALTGLIPDDADEEDFKCFTCGISRFVRRSKGNHEVGDVENWRMNGGVAGGWDCISNSDCSHLSQGEERGWHFHGDESFDSYGKGLKREPITSAGGIESSRQQLEDTNKSSAKL